METITSIPFAIIIGLLAFALLAFGILISISDLRKRHESERNNKKERTHHIEHPSPLKH
jgi:glucose uptake protein GlcU